MDLKALSDDALREEAVRHYVPLSVFCSSSWRLRLADIFLVLVGVTFLMSSPSWAYVLIAMVVVGGYLYFSRNILRGEMPLELEPHIAALDAVIDEMQRRHLEYPYQRYQLYRMVKPYRRKNMHLRHALKPE